MPRWSEEQSYTFVALYRQFEFLWNVFHPSYKNREARLEAFNHMAERMNIPGFTVNEVPKKIRNFRSTYNQELAKMSRAGMSGEEDTLYTTTLRWFADMEFVMNNSNSAAIKRDSVEIEIVGCPETNAAIDTIKDDEEHNTNEHLSVTNSRVKTRKRLRLTDIKEKKLSRIQNTTVIPSSSATTREAEDECDVFGKHVATQLRKLPVDDMMDAQMDIQQILVKFRKKNSVTTGCNA